MNNYSFFVLQRQGSVHTSCLTSSTAGFLPNASFLRLFSLLAFTPFQLTCTVFKAPHLPHHSLRDWLSFSCCMYLYWTGLKTRTPKYMCCREKERKGGGMVGFWSLEEKHLQLYLCFTFWVSSCCSLPWLPFISCSSYLLTCQFTGFFKRKR